VSTREAADAIADLVAAIADFERPRWQQSDKE
jgi:hypothetical protein